MIYLKNYIRESIFGPLFKLFEASFELLIPLLVASVIDEGIARGEHQIIITKVLFMVLLGVIGLVCAMTAQYFAAKAATGFGAELRKALFSHIQELSFPDLDRLGTSTLITRLTSDVNSVQSSMNMFLRLFMRSPFIVFGAMIMAMTIDMETALIFGGTILALSAVVFTIMLVSIRLYEKVQGNLDQVLKLTRENLTGTRVVRAFHKEKESVEDFQSMNTVLQKYQMTAGRVSALMNPLTFVLINVGLIVLIHTGAIKVDGGSLSQGQVVALVNYMSQILVELIKLANLIIQLTKAFASAERIKKVLDTTCSMEYPAMDSDTAQSDYVIDFDHAGIRYGDDAEESLSDVTFKVRKGETLGIIGGTGSGKSTLVNLIPRFYDVTAGSVKIDGIDVRNYTKDTLRDKIGMVMQKAVLFRGTVRENLMWGDSKATEETLAQALQVAQAADFVQKESLEAQILQGGRNLSGGQRQRLTIARALVRQPEILILDDSSSALDYATDAKLRHALKAMNITTVIVSQRTSSIAHADQIVVLEDGAVAGLGTHEELLSSCSVYQEIHTTEASKKEGGAGI